MKGNCLSRRDLLKAGLLAAGAMVLPHDAVLARADAVHLDVPFRYQHHALSCEMAALRMAAEYYGLIFSEDELLRIMPCAATQPRVLDGEVLWADPNRVFPGSYRGWQLYRGGLSEHPDRARRGLWGYGVHAPVIAAVAVAIGLQAEVFDRAEDAYRSLERGRVPIVIVPEGTSTGMRWAWFTPSGEAVPVINGEHSVVVRGYNDRMVLVHDPKGKVYHYDRPAFEKAFGLQNSGVAIGPRQRYVPRRLEPR